MMLRTGSFSFRAGRQACFLATVSFKGLLYQSKTTPKPLHDADKWLIQLQTGQAGMPASLAAADVVNLWWRCVAWGPCCSGHAHVI